MLRILAALAIRASFGTVVNSLLVGISHLILWPRVLVAAHMTVESGPTGKHLAASLLRAHVRPAPRVRASVAGERAAVRKTLSASLKLALVRSLTAVNA